MHHLVGTGMVEMVQEHTKHLPGLDVDTGVCCGTQELGPRAEDSLSHSLEAPA